MTERTFVVGVGMTKFEKPGSKDWDYPDMGRGGRPERARRRRHRLRRGRAGLRRLLLRRLHRRASGRSTSSGLTGIPVVNVNNNCSTGSSALYLARQFVEGGLADCVLALGFEKMEKGASASKFTDRTNPMDKHFEDMIDRRGFAPAPPAAQMFGNAGREYMERYGVDRRDASPRSARRTTATRSTTRTRSSRTSTRSRRSWRRRWSTTR